MVVAPYASLLALPFALPAVMANLDRLDGLGATGRYGLYEAVDFTAARLEAGTTRAIVRSFMAHHQGMILTAINNRLHGEPMVRRFHADAHRPDHGGVPLRAPGRRGAQKADTPRTRNPSRRSGLAGGPRAVAGASRRRLSPGPRALERSLPRPRLGRRRRQRLGRRGPHTLAGGQHARQSRIPALPSRSRSQALVVRGARRRRDGVSRPHGRAASARPRRLAPRAGVRRAGR